MIAAIRDRLLEPGTPFALVAGAVALAQVKDRPPALPAAYVMPVRAASEPNSRMASPMLQRTATDVAVIIIFEQLAAPLGDPAADLLEELVTWVRGRLLGLTGADFEPLEHVSGEMIQARGGTVWWEETWGTAHYQEQS